MKLSIILATAIIGTTTIATAQIQHAKTESVKVYGNCGTCEKNIEKAANQNKVSKADWNRDTKMASITFDSTKTNINNILKKIALAGYDNEKFSAPETAYKHLDGCCQYERPDAALLNIPGASATSEMIQDANPQTANNEANQDQITPLANSYFELKDALVADNTAMAKTKAEALSAVLTRIDMHKLDPKVHTEWMKVQANIKSETQAIATGKGIDKQRLQFAKLSQDLYPLLKLSAQNGTIYYQHCPMYMDGKGANWLSRDKEIKNPYYGSAMLSCGNIIETIQ